MLSLSVDARLQPGSDLPEWVDKVLQGRMVRNFMKALAAGVVKLSLIQKESASCFYS